MRYSIIEELFYYRRGYPDSVKMTEKYWKAHDKFSTLYEEFMGQLNGEQQEKLKRLLDLEDEMDLESTDAHYFEGFKVGLLLGVESSVT